MQRLACGGISIVNSTFCDALNAETCQLVLMNFSNKQCMNLATLIQHSKSLRVRQNRNKTLPQSVNLNDLLLYGEKGLDIAVPGILLYCVYFRKKNPGYQLSGIDHARSLHRVSQILGRLPPVHLKAAPQCFLPWFVNSFAQYQRHIYNGFGRLRRPVKRQ